MLLICTRKIGFKNELSVLFNKTALQVNLNHDILYFETYSKMFTEIMTKASFLSTIVDVGHVYWGIASYGKKTGTINRFDSFLQRGALLVKVSVFESVSFSCSSLWVLVWDFVGWCWMSCGLVKGLQTAGLVS